MSNVSDFEVEILQLINNHRATLDLHPLSLHDPIQETSTTHSNNIAQGAVPFGHQGFPERANQLIQLLNGSAASENVAMGQRTTEEVVSSWLNSAGHRKNIEGDYNLTGISVIKTPEGENIFTQIFIKAPSPSIIPSSPPTATNKTDEGDAKTKTNSNINYILLKKINEHRVSKNLSPLQINPHIQVTATQHAQNMASGKIPFSHEGFQERAKSLIEKLSGSSVAENVAIGQEDAQLIINSWLDSAGHKGNIEGNFNLTGIGIALGADEKMYYCQIFIKK
jgi:uncharacterized protein YkwD